MGLFDPKVVVLCHNATSLYFPFLSVVFFYSPSRYVFLNWMKERSNNRLLIELEHAANIPDSSTYILVETPGRSLPDGCVRVRTLFPLVIFDGERSIL